MVPIAWLVESSRRDSEQCLSTHPHLCVPDVGQLCTHRPSLSWPRPTETLIKVITEISNPTSCVHVGLGSNYINPKRFYPVFKNLQTETSVTCSIDKCFLNTFYLFQYSARCWGHRNKNDMVTDFKDLRV